MTEADLLQAAISTPRAICVVALGLWEQALLVAALRVGVGPSTDLFRKSCIHVRWYRSTSEFKSFCNTRPTVLQPQLHMGFYSVSGVFSALYSVSGVLVL